MIPGTYDHVIYEIQGDLSDLAQVKDNELLDKKVVKRTVEATLDLHADMSISDELGIYLKEILSLDDSKIRNIMGVFNDYSTKTEVG